MSESKTILVIDDEADLVFLLQSILTHQGYHVVTARNGQEGLTRLKSTIPHLIILDMNMPKMGGIAFYHAIADRKSGNARYPVLVLTARSNLEKLFTEFHVDGFMTKPFEIEDLLSEIRAILTKHAEPAAPDPVKKQDPTPKRILIVENNQETFAQLLLACIERGYLVSGAHAAAMGIEHAAQELPDMILMKWNLPDLSGAMAAAILKQMPKTRDIPLILYASKGECPEENTLRAICEKAQVKNLVSSSEAAVLLQEAETLFHS